MLESKQQYKRLLDRLRRSCHFSHEDEVASAALPLPARDPQQAYQEGLAEGKRAPSADQQSCPAQVETHRLRPRLFGAQGEAGSSQELYVWSKTFPKRSPIPLTRALPYKSIHPQPMGRDWGRGCSPEPFDVQGCPCLPGPWRGPCNARRWPGHPPPWPSSPAGATRPGKEAPGSPWRSCSAGSSP